ncbi:hypothetical protein BDF20DRAFT_904718 [Mycotypha africana]|uniref:uncharacterized protein n=1 Tax=Mycotypha africana TaxID=64632 RepID=UPI00230137C7|nr:uncharacterized protein BDF20DRAFT_904718 [Mycotypha africana]KAI8987790.1 hypothetical protein BDF20DRAFT_904718 [Mycotypha africana]
MFAAVLLQINLKDHRVMFRTYPFTFTTDEAAKVMSCLTFIYIHRKPDPIDPTRQIATRTTTTFSMDVTTAKNILQLFLSARLICSATDPTNWSIRDKGLWCPTMKGKYVMEEFADTTQVEMSATLIAALNAPYMALNTSCGSSTGSRIITLDRLIENDDQITFSRPNMTAVFKAMMSSLPRDTLLVDDVPGIDKKSLDKYEYTFVGTYCIEWLCERLTINSEQEAESVAAQFVLFGWIAQIQDRSNKSHSDLDESVIFKTGQRGCLILGWKLPKQISEPVIHSSTHSISSGFSLESDNSSLNKTSKKPVLYKPLSKPGTDTASKFTQQATPPSSIELSPPADRPAPEPPGVSTTQMMRQDSGAMLFGQVHSQSSISQDSSCAEINIPTQERHHTSPRPPSMSITDSALSHTSSNSASNNNYHQHTNKDNSNWNKLTQILESPLIRMYFRNFLRENYAAENINFWVEHDKLLRNFKQNNRSLQEQLAECYTIYDTYLGPNATTDVNIDHSLHQEIIKFVATVFTTMSTKPPPPTPTNSSSSLSDDTTNEPFYFTVPSNLVLNASLNKPSNSIASSNRLLLMPPQTVAADLKQRIIRVRGIPPEKCLIKMLRLLSKVNDHLCRMMAEDSVPKFIKTEKYKELMEAQRQQKDKVDEAELSDDELSFEDSMCMEWGGREDAKVKILKQKEAIT